MGAGILRLAEITTKNGVNLQVLCSKCNRSKGNKDQTDFRGEIANNFEVGCLLCEKMKYDDTVRPFIQLETLRTLPFGSCNSG